jgi:hypothetical protein
MPSIRIHLNSLNDLDELDPEEIDELTGATQRQREVDLTGNMDARARSAELRDRRRNDKRKNVSRGTKRYSSSGPR